MTRLIALAPLCAVLFFWGCKGVPATADQTATATAAAHAEEAAPAADCADHGEGAEAHDCVGGAAPGKDDVRKVTNGAGETILAAGQALGDAETYAIADLLSEGEALQGKQIRIEGNVAAMCHHKRGWFALVGDDASGQFVRVLTAPGFLVPAGSVGKKARTVGTIDVVEISAATAQHFAESHKLTMPEPKNGKVKQLILRAVGAEFI